MTTITAPMWVDLSAGDVAAERGFYGEVLGWTYDDAHPDAGGWRQARAGGEAAAGVSPRPPGVPFTSWQIFFGTDDIAGAIAHAASLGATPVMPPMPVVIGGELTTTIAVLIDPTGAAFGIAEPGTHKGFKAPQLDAGVPDGTPTWFELMSRDPRASAEFYAALTGAQINEAPESPMPYWVLSIDGLDFAGIMGFPPDVPDEVPPYWSPYFAVADVDAATERARAAGATVLMGPENVGPGRLAMLLDPENAAFNVMHVTDGSDS